MNGKNYFYATSGGFADIASEGVQLLLETAEEASTLDEKRVEGSLNRAEERFKDIATDPERTSLSVKRAQNRLLVIKTLSKKKT